jgi:hypothetical protein
MRGRKAPLFFTGKGADKLRLAQVEEIGRVAGREFTIIRARGSQMALSASGVTWWELFASQAQEKDVRQTRAEAELRREEEEERKRYKTAGVDFDNDEAAEFFRYKRQMFAEGKPVRHLTLDYFGAVKQEYRALKQEQQKGGGSSSFLYDFLKRKDEEKPEKNGETLGRQRSEGGRPRGESTESSEKQSTAASWRAFAPDGRTEAARHDAESERRCSAQLYRAAFVMTPERSGSCSRSGLSARGHAEEQSERVKAAGDAQNHPEGAAQAAPPSKRVARQRWSSSARQGRIRSQ